MKYFVAISCAGILMVILVTVGVALTSESSSTEIHPTDPGSSDVWTRERMENSTPLPMPVDDR